MKYGISLVKTINITRGSSKLMPPFFSENEHG
jgi:hypothetical protein